MVCWVSFSGWMVGMRDVGGDYYVELAAAVMHWHVSAFTGVFAVREELGHEVGEGEAALLEDARFAVLGEDDVVGG